ncbi:MAG: hypothetical protein HY911_15945 [Desulfobacterales bacterium]|nr:hypothetical protein [Desulfobacterales bacterium]
MNRPDNQKGNVKAKIVHEFVEYWINVAYLTLMFATFTQYRRLILAAHDIAYTNYWFAVIEALILAKVIMIGDVLRLGRGLEQKPLIYPTLYKTAIFTLFVGIFTVLEHVIKSLWKGVALTGDIAAFLGKGPDEFLANAMVVFVAFIPFFGVKELGRVLGEDKIRTLFFRRRTEP